ncbi:MAG: hypothetical protein A2Y17_08920 [Clostridiales bacterium GWF2_38_85]|nr:MAG: hypothetical protein A2Y17_08920 [Clostridiales bacterium GWF2_38_85]HBL83682.1 hypothetical protein [Clostridiales bacterium]
MDKQKVVFTDEEKLDYFIKRVSELSHGDEDKIRNEIDEYKSDFLGNAVKALENEIAQYIQQIRSKGITNYDIAKSRLVLEQKHELIRMREDKKNDLKSKLTEKAIAFTESNQYIDFLKELVEKAYNSVAEGVLSLNSDDIKYADDIKNYIKAKSGFEINIVSEPLIKLGGIRLYNQKTGILINETLESRIERIIDKIALDDIL